MSAIKEFMIKSIRTRPAYIAVAGLVLLVLILGALMSSRKDEGKSDDPLYTVKSGPLTISLTEAGRLRNKDEIVIKNESKRSLKIVSLVPEGSVVTNGQLLIQLDSEALQTEVDDNTLNVKRAESDLLAAQKRREILTSQKQSDIEQAELNLKFANLDLKRFIEGVHPKNLEAAKSQITLAKANLERAEKDYSWSEKLFEKGFITERDLKADELTAQQSRINLKIKETELKLMEEYTHPQEVENLKSTTNQTFMALDRAKLTAKAELASQQASLFHFEAELAKARKNLVKAAERLEACTIVAPADGMVIYATSGGKKRWHSEREQMDVGATVHPMHSLIRMPMNDVMLAEISVIEATKPKLYEGMVAVVTVDALPGKVFRGKLTRIGILPDSTQAWLNPDLKVYTCEVQLDTSVKEMRPDMNCKVDIVVEEYQDAMAVPIQCVVHIDGEPYVYVKKFGGFKKRKVQTGMDNNVVVHILAGLDEGDQVMLAPPLDESVKKNGGGKKKPTDSKKTSRKSRK